MTSSRIGYAAFAFALGVTAGVLIRRTLPAMATTLAGFVATRLLFNHFVLPKLITPTHESFALNQQTVQGFGQMNGGPFTLFPGNPDIPNAWFYSTQFVDRAGHPLSAQVLSSVCPQLVAGTGPVAAGSGAGVRSAVPVPGGRAVLQDCINKLGETYHEAVAFQPAGRYWSFQWLELAIYLGVALFLGTFCVWWVRRRLS